ncbi:MAG TPA: hypothetical protein VN361_00855, partial [Oxalicibacterium sp.]|nr:hypothetical protein [Oxalicibacterium sp.]
MNVHEHHRRSSASNSASCCASGCVAPAAAAVDHTPAIAGAQRARYQIANMDCPNEERLIRNKLDGMPGIVRLDF